MEVILVQDVDNLGKAGERIRVRDGFSRNYLIPNRLAVPVTESGLKFLEAKKKRAEEKRVQAKEEMNQLSQRLQKWSCILKMKVGAEGKLYGSVTRNDVHAELEKAGFQIDKRKIDLPGVINHVGEFQVQVRLHPELETIFKVVVTGA